MLGKQIWTQETFPRCSGPASPSACLCDVGKVPQLPYDSVGSSVKWHNKRVCTTCPREAVQEPTGNGSAGCRYREFLRCRLVPTGLPPTPQENLPVQECTAERLMSGEIQELGHDGRHFIKEDVSGPPDPRSPSFPPPHPGSGAPASLVPSAPWPPCSAPSLGLPLPCQHLSSLPDWRARDLTLALTPCSPEPSSAHGHQPPAASSGLPSRHLAVLFPCPQTGPPPATLGLAT